MNELTHKKCCFVVELFWSLPFSVLFVDWNCERIFQIVLENRRHCLLTWPTEFCFMYSIVLSKNVWSALSHFLIWRTTALWTMILCQRKQKRRVEGSTGCWWKCCFFSQQVSRRQRDNHDVLHFPEDCSKNDLFNLESSSMNCGHMSISFVLGTSSSDEWKQVKRHLRQLNVSQIRFMHERWKLSSMVTNCLCDFAADLQRSSNRLADHFWHSYRKQNRR